MSFKQVDISSKPVVYREATATGRIRLKSSTVRLIRGGKLEKGDPLSLAKLTGILAAKQAPSLLPLCHRDGGAHGCSGGPPEHLGRREIV